MLDFFLVYGLFLLANLLAGLIVPHRLAGRVFRISAVMALIVTIGGAVYLWVQQFDWGDNNSELIFAGLSFLFATLLFSVVGLGLGQAIRWFVVQLARLVRGES